MRNYNVLPEKLWMPWLREVMDAMVVRGYGCHGCERLWMAWLREVMDGMVERSYGWHG
jgi:hypothetical protein